MWLNPLGIVFFFNIGFLFQSLTTLITRQQKLPLNQQKKLIKNKKKLLYFTVHCIAVLLQKYSEINASLILRCNTSLMLRCPNVEMSLPVELILSAKKLLLKLKVSLYNSNIHMNQYLLLFVFLSRRCLPP